MDRDSETNENQLVARRLKFDGEEDMKSPSGSNEDKIIMDEASNAF